MVFEKNQVYTVKIDDIGTDGEGIGKVDGYTLFVKDALIGDVANVKLMKSKKTYGYAKLEEIIEASPMRTEPKCVYYRQCGGCQIQAMKYESQLLFKQEKIRNNLLRLGKFTKEEIDAVMEPIVGMEKPWAYRNKAQFPVGTDKNGKIITGFYAGRTHSIIANTDCKLGVPENQKILETIIHFMEEHHILPYHEETGKGLVRHVLIRKGFASGEIMVCLILNGKDLPKSNLLINQLKEIPGMKSISINVNQEKTNVILGKENFTIWGEDTISDSIEILQVTENGFEKSNQSVSFSISPQSFYQVNPEQTEKLYSLALDYAELTGKESVWDLYCGIGTISLFLAGHAKQVYGVEIIPQAIEDAKKNAQNNGIENATFFVGKAEQVLPEFYEQKSESEMLHPDVIVVDPPRKGCDQDCLNTMLKMQPKRIVYVSCDSATLARDLRILVDGGYTLKKVRGVDQFAQTVHVETVCQLIKE